MSRRLQLHDDADLELNEAADYYDLKSPGLGRVFLDEIDGGFARIRRYPHAAPEVAPDVRKLVLGKFPFTIIYSVRPDLIRILSIAHQRKRPYFWRNRAWHRGGSRSVPPAMRRLLSGERGRGDAGRPALRPRGPRASGAHGCAASPPPPAPASSPLPATPAPQGGDGAHARRRAGTTACPGAGACACAPRAAPAAPRGVDANR